MNYMEEVEKFHKVFGLPVGSSPQLIPQKQFANRLRLITEELSEYCEGVAEGNIVKVADGLADLLVVVFGTAVEHGLPMNEIFQQVSDSNMSKEDGYKDKAGKWIKPDNYTPVNLLWLKERIKNEHIN